jgi:hypothetical protein
MIWALLAMYLFGSASGTAPFSDAFEGVKIIARNDVEDKARAKELLAVIDESEKTLKEYTKIGRKPIKELAGIIERHDAKAGDFLPVLERLRADTAACQDKMVRYRFVLKTKMSREEWSKAFPNEASLSVPPEVLGK